MRDAVKFIGASGKKFKYMEAYNAARSARPRALRRSGILCTDGMQKI